MIVCILVAGGLFLLKMNGALKCSGGSLSSLTSSSNAQKTGTTVTDTTAEPGSSADATPQVNEAEQPSETAATLEELVAEDGTSMVRITVLVPAKATMTIAIPNPRMNDYIKSNSDDVAKLFALKIDDSAFYDEQPLTEATVVYQPKITIQTAHGDVYDVECPSFTRTYSPLSITLTSPLAQEDGTIMAAEGNVVHFEGKMNIDTGVNLTINGTKTPVYESGVFFYDYQLTGDQAETIKLEASAAFHAPAETEVLVQPYVFTPDPMVLEVNGDLSTLRGDNSGKLTVTGTTLPGATVDAVSDNTANVFCGTVNVDNDGKFSLQITMPDFYGISKITLTARKQQKDVLVEDSLTFSVIRAYKDKDTFVKTYQKSKTYKQVNIDTTIAELQANLATYATNNYGYRLSAVVNEVNTVDGVQIVKMTVLKTNETIYMRNLSKADPASNIGKKYNFWCSLVGEYEDTGCLEFIGWFGKGI